MRNKFYYYIEHPADGGVKILFLKIILRQLADLIFKQNSL